MNTQEIHHYAMHTLENDKPDIVIINAGSNDTRNEKPIVIAENIINIAILCKNYGVNQVFVPGITPRREYQTKIDDVNDLLRNKQHAFNYVFIKNENIIASEHL